jgi:hypothetical protein
VPRGIDDDVFGFGHLDESGVDQIAHRGGEHRVVGERADHRGVARLARRHAAADEARRGDQQARARQLGEPAVLAVPIVSGYGFAVWISQIIGGPPGG